MDQCFEKFREDNLTAFELYERHQALVESGEAEEGSGPQCPPYDEKDWENKFDAETADIEIPEPIADEVDNDWVLTSEEADALIDKYIESKQYA